MARTATGAAALFVLLGFSWKCATQAVEVICRICVQVRPRRSGSAPFVAAGLACAKSAGARTRRISNAENNLIPGKPPAALLRTRIAHLEEIEFLLEAPQHFIIDLIVIAHIQQGRALQGADILG